MRPQDAVAILLTVGVLAMLLSSTYLRCAWMDCTIIHPMVDERAQFWSNVMNIILGALAGYIASETRHRPPPPPPPPKEENDNETDQ